MVYRTRTYIAADWDGDHDAVEQLHKWNDSDYWGLSFPDAHELHQSRDTSLYCSIKKSLKERMDRSKRFALVVGDHTATVTKGSCSYCGSCNSWTKSCARPHSIDRRSYIEYECDEAVKAGIEVVVLYNDIRVDKSKCPEAVRWRGDHVPMVTYRDGNYYWDYQAIKNALG
ncbi:molecular chaperone Tir [uncultured Senegalimassilia sp.]|uniref:TIR domain-containing protein n=1 Tax=uncultured Senegalimassilia sp. TaxID=1714350 RepID=UPI0025CE6E49|nr:molecular chaperone Tir [uncultured Senegalimassilia sp.]